jgi:phosphohistidine phosphatase
MRHAKSDRDAPARRDFDRPLDERGRRDAPRMGWWMKRQGFVPDLVVASPAARARDTAERVGEALGLGDEAVAWEERLYDASLAAILEVLAGLPGGAARVLLVAHNPGLEDLVSHLGGASVVAPPDGKLLPTAAVARIAMPADWTALAPGAGRLREIVRPRDLEDG